MQDTARIATVVAEKILVDLKLIPEFITYSEVRKIYGRNIADRARSNENIEWFPLAAKGKGFSVYCRRNEFSNFLFDRNSFNQ